MAIPTIMQLNSTVTLGDILTIVAILVSVIGVLISLRMSALQKRRENVMAEAAFFRDYSFRFYDNPSIISIFTDLDRGRLEIEPGDSLDRDKEIQLLSLLDHLDSFAYNWIRADMPLVEVSDTIMGYATHRCYKHPVIQEYFKFADEYSKDYSAPGEPFRFLIELGKRIEKARQQAEIGV